MLTSLYILTLILNLFMLAVICSQFGEMIGNRHIMHITRQDSILVITYFSGIVLSTVIVFSLLLGKL